MILRNRQREVSLARSRVLCTWMYMPRPTVYYGYVRKKLLYNTGKCCKMLPGIIFFRDLLCIDEIKKVSEFLGVVFGNLLQICSKFFNM